jgi:hypothetical protein
MCGRNGEKLFMSFERAKGIRPVRELMGTVGPEGGWCVSRKGKKKGKTREI